jgi:isochorismate pyruvate lyase
MHEPPGSTTTRRRAAPAGPGGDAVARTPAEDCTEMAEVREEIDRIDRLLVTLIAERQGYIEAAARIKPRADEVRLEWRIEDVVAKVLRSAEAAGLSKRIAEPVWRTLIDRCIEHEHEFWRLFHNRNVQK